MGDVADHTHGRPHAIPGTPEWFCGLWRPMPGGAGTSMKIFLRLIIIIRAKGAFSVGVEIGRSSRKECPRTMSVPGM